MTSRRERLAAEIGVFMRQYGRKKQHGLDPNDRGYDRDIEQVVKRLDPQELDALLRDKVDDDEAEPPRPN